MQATQLDGGFADTAREAARVFRAALETLARPGLIETVTGGQAPAPASVAASVLILTLCDDTTPLYLAPSHDSTALRDWITFHTGARFAGPEHAMFALGTWEALQPVSRFSVGTSEYPDRAATLIVEMAALRPDGATLRGPGIRDTATLGLPETAAFQSNRARFPLGFDCYFTCGDRLAGLPRSTIVEG